jgi:hydroxyacylglutathione hydrolase
MIFKQISVNGDRNFAYVIGDQASREAVIVDPSFKPELALEEARRHGLKVRYVISTHSHRDHVIGNAYIVEHANAVEVMHESTSHPCHVRITDNEELTVGALTLRFLHTPGHIPDHICVLVGGKLLTGDILFVGKVGGTGPHFPASDARQQWESLQRLMKLDPATEVWPGHDYGISPSSTIGKEAATNPFLFCKSVDEFLHLKEHWAEYKKLHGIG